jgi:hypothetical protein
MPSKSEIEKVMKWRIWIWGLSEKQ